MTYREAADILANKNPWVILMFEDVKKREEAVRLAVEVLNERAEQMEKAETVPYKEI